MTAASIHLPTSIDFGNLYQYADARFEDPRQFDEVYFMADHTETFAWRALQIARELPNFAGIAVFSVSPGKRTRLAQQLPLTANWRFIAMQELVERAASKKILVLDFNEYLAGKNIALALAAQGVTVRDCLFGMHQLGLKHTYETVKEERDYVVANLSKFIALAERFKDDTSRKTLYARLQMMLTLERRPLLEVSFPLSVFINNFSRESGLVVGDKDVFVDVGAAHGDTVSQFFQLTRGKYRAMHAFEPDSANFAALQALSSYLPNVTPYFAGLGEEAAEVDFFECPDNRFGSNFTANPAANVKKTVKIMRLDDVVGEATLIKIDVEGFESKVIKGSANVIRNHKPDMTISAYHYAKDIIEILETVTDIAPYEHVALRHYSPNLFDTQLVFSDRQAFG
jgi:FkbM family methyltransferase